MKKWILPALAGIAMMFIYGQLQGKEKTSVRADHPPASKGAKPPLPQGPTPQTATSPIARMPAAAPADLGSLERLAKTLAQVGQPSYPLKNLVEELQDSGQEPFVVRDANPDTGEMIIVRTKSPLPGTRYFHAQYFTSDNGERFVQHMSFEFKPGENAMAAAVATVERSFTNLSRPEVQREDYVKWNLGDDYIVWVKKMSNKDLQDDPFNAYTLQDDGTIRVAVELEIHGE